MGSLAADVPPMAQPDKTADAHQQGKQADVSDAVRRAVEDKIYGYFYSFVEMGVVKAFIDHHVFAALPADGSAVTTAALAAATGASPGILDRFCGYLVASDVLSAGPGPGEVAHGRTSRFFLDAGVALMLGHLFDNTLLPVAHWPEYFARHGLAEPARADATPWGLAWGHPDKTNYDVFALFPEMALPFNASMRVGVHDMPITGMYDFGWVGEYAGRAGDGGGGGDADRTLLVDVGGGMGQALRAILAENPAIPPRRCALQDRPETIAEVEKEADAALAQVQKFGASFHGEEPVKGALLYHIRRVLNDWPDADAVNILARVRAACAPDSRVLVSEQLVADDARARPRRAAALDLFMLNFAGKRRSARQYAALAAAAGLALASVSRHPSVPDAAVLELVVAAA